MQKSTIKKVNDYQSLYNTNTWQVIEKKLSERKRKRVFIILFFIAILASGLVLINQKYSTKESSKEAYIPTP
jgi:hypothetical protein